MSTETSDEQPTAKHLMSYGFFPNRINDCFTGKNFAGALSKLPPIGDLPKGERVSQSTLTNSVRPGGTRRKFATPNPFSQALLAKEIEDHWEEIYSHISQSKYSLSRPIPSHDKGSRALVFNATFRERSLARTRLYSMTGATLVADITDFYGSIYTHTIEWALSSRKESKTRIRGGSGKQKFEDLPLGARLDTLIRNCNDGQTKGIPMGPDTSHVIAEIVLCAIDQKIAESHRSLNNRTLRFMDDYEYFSPSTIKAQEALHVLDSTLTEYGLSINRLKTYIADSVPYLEAPWKYQLSSARLRKNSDIKLANDISDYLNETIRLSLNSPTDPVFEYAILRLSNITIRDESWVALQNFLLAAASIQPSCLGHVEKALTSATKQGAKIDRDRIKNVLNTICAKSAPLGHGSEVSWALRIAHDLGIRIGKTAAKAVIKMEDNFCLIQLKELEQAGLIYGQKLNWDDVIKRCQQDEVYLSSDWLLGYHFSVNGYCSPSTFKKSTYWSRLLKLKIQFFEPPHIHGRKKSGSKVGSSSTPSASDTILKDPSTVKQNTPPFGSNEGNGIPNDDAWSMTLDQGTAWTSNPYN